MFATPEQMPSGLPQFQTGKALIVMSMQNDLFYVREDFYLLKNRDFVPRLKEMIPYFRKEGEIIWVVSHMGSLSPPQTKDTSQVEGDSAKAAEQNRQARMEEEAQLEDKVPQSTVDQSATSSRPPNTILGTTPVPYPSSKSRGRMAQHSADARAKKREIDMTAYDDGDNVLAEQLTKPRKGQQPQFCIAGTKGAEICDELKDLVHEDDMVVVKHYYSAFDQTSLLMSLRMSLCTEVYLCGCFTNTSIYSTAADAVQHGLQVTVVEDCLGYRNEEKHEEALRQMSDLMGANGTDSEEIIEEAGGRAIPDSETPGITLRDLSIGSEAREAQASLVPQLEPGLGLWSSKSRGDPATGAGDGDSTQGASPKPSGGPLGKTNRHSLSSSKAQTLGAGDTIGSGDSRIIYHALSPRLAEDVFDELKNEVEWKKMYHRSGEVPRLVAVQGNIGDDNSVPIYRHPADESPPLLSFTPSVTTIRKEVERLLKQPFNHALIQFYRGGEDHISEHADKENIVHGSSVINVSLGAQRVMTLRTKKSEGASARQSQRINMPHNSVFVLGPQTNREWLHGVRADKRPHQEKTEEEMAFNGGRISITFRQIGTFMHEEAGRIWGSGAKSKTKATAGRISTDDAEMERMIQAFGKENHQSNFDWEAHYGSGFDVVHLVDRQARLILCMDPIANIRAKLALHHKSIPYQIVETSSTDNAEFRFTPWTHGLANLEKPILKETGEDQAETEGDLGILFHLEKQHPSADLEGIEGYTNAQLFRCATQSNELLYMWRELQLNPPSSPTHRFKLERPLTPNSSLLKEIQQMLQSWEDYLEEEEYAYVAGEAWTILDCAFWPVLHEVLTSTETPRSESFPCLTAYHRRGLDRVTAARALEERT